MNINRYRIVFNRVRGLLMAVAETACSQGSGKGTRAPSTAGATSKATSSLTASALALAVWAATGLGSPGNAQIVADPTAPATQRPTVLVDGAGRPLVNIQTPSAAGVSRNTYSQFDVQGNGVVLNNARLSNPWLATGEARVILNEVNSSNPSHLRGAITVNGARAQVVIANPSGIQVDGASFINTSRATLTTGTPIFSDGELTGLRVRQGTVNILGGGLNMQGVNYTDVLARAAVIAGRIDANPDAAVSITTGTQEVDYANGQLTPVEGSGAAPAIAIDTVALGGMYAGKITLLATEAGVGVRNAGTLQAGLMNGQLVITADGRLENLGHMQAAVTSLATVTGDIDNSGVLKGRSLLMVGAGGNFNQQGSGMVQDVEASNSVVVRARNDVNLLADSALTSLGTTGRIDVSAGRDIRLGNASRVGAGGDVQFKADGWLVAGGAQVESLTGGAIALAGQGVHMTQTHVTGDRVHLETGALFQDTASHVVLVGGQFNGSSQTAVVATGDAWIDGTRLHSDGDVHVQANRRVDILAGSVATAGEDFTATAGDALTFWGASGSVAWNGRAVDVAAGGQAHVAGASVSMHGARIHAGGDVSVAAHEGDATLYALPNANGAAHDRVQLHAGGDLTVSAYQGGLWAWGLNASGDNLGLVSNGTTKVAHVVSRDGLNATVLGSDLNAREDLTVGSVGEAGTVEVTASTLAAAGQARVMGNRDVLLYAADDTRALGAGTLTTSARTSIQASSVRVQGGSIYTQAANLDALAGDVSLASTQGSIQLGSHNGNRTELDASSNLAMHAHGQLDLWYANANAGKNLVGTSAQGDIKGVGSVLIAKDMLSLASKGPQNHWDGFYDGGALSMYTDDGHIALYNTRLQTRSTQDAALQSLTGQLSVESGAGMTVDAASVFSATTDLSIIAGSGDVTLTPWWVGSSAPGLVLSQSQLGMGRGFALAARNGKLSLTGQQGYHGFGSSQRVDLDLLGDIRLIGNEVDLAGSKLRTAGRVDVTATGGDLNVYANKATAYEYGFTNTYWDRTEIAASQGFDLRSLGDIDINGLWAYTWGQGNVLAGGNVSISGVYNQWQYQAGASLWEQHYLTESQLTGEQGVSVAALGGHLTLNATNVSSGAGDVRLQALGDVVLEAAPEHALYQSSSTHVQRKWYGKKKVTTYSTHNESMVASPVWIDGQDIEIKAGNNVRTNATQFSARGNLHIEAGDQAEYFAVRDQSYSHSSVSRTSSWLGIRYKSSDFSDSRQLNGAQTTMLQSQGSIVSLSGGDQTLQGTDVVYGGTATFAVGVGEKARADARLILEGVIESVAESRTLESDAVVWMKQSGEGSTRETLKLPSFSGPSAPVFNGPVLANIPAGDFTTQIATLSQQPGMGYLSELGQRQDVNWRPVQLAYDQWQYEQEGLTGAGAALVAVAVAWATGGMGAEMIGATNTSLTGAMANAAFVSLSSQAAISFINNKGDIGKTLKDLGRSDVVKATVAAALTAGVLNQLGAIPGMGELQQSASWSDKLTFNLINAGGRALTTAAIEGGDLEDALRGALLGGLIDTVHGSVAGHIKGLEAGYLAHKLAHALAGCVAGAAAGGECRDGAIGAAVGEVVAELFKGQKPGAYASDAEWRAYDDKVLAYSKIVAGGIAAYAGGDAQAAITTAETAVRHNFLTFDENQLRKQATEQCKAGDAQACADEQRWRAIDTSRDGKVREVCSSAPASEACADWRALALLARDSYTGRTGGSAGINDLLSYGQDSNIQELHSIQQLIATTPYAYNVTASPHLRSLASIAADLTPIVGDIKGFYEASDPFDYALAMVGALGPVGDGAAAALRAAKAAHEVGDATQVAANLGKASAEAKEAVQARFGLSFDASTRTWTSPAGLDYGPGSIHGNRVKHVLAHTVPNPSKPAHSVFSVPRADVLKLVDEAWENRAGAGTLQANGNRMWVINMGRQVGAEGQTSIQLVTRDGTNQLVTAYPR